MLRLLGLVVMCSKVLGADQECSGGLECVGQNNCPGFAEQKGKLHSLQKGSVEYRELLRTLKELVCNKQQKKVCCEKKIVEETTQTQSSPIPEDSPSWVPSLVKQECGVTAGHLGFVVGGNDTKLGEFPWTVLLGKSSGNSGRTRWYCGGTLINKWYVVTAAHCGPKVDKVRVGDWKVVDTSKPDLDTCTAYSRSQKRRCDRASGCGRCSLKTDDVDCLCHESLSVCPKKIENICTKEPQDIEVEEVKPHEAYRKLPTGIAINDIMLLKLKYPANLDSFTKPICLSDEKETQRIRRFGEKGMERLLSYGKPLVVGWGQTYEPEDQDISIVSSASQQKLALPVVSNQACADKYGELFKRDVSTDIRVEEHICAGGEKDKDSCKGDSGGPLIGRDGDDNPWVLVGVVSAGTKTCGIGAPGIFTRVTHYRDWILENLI